jgi:AI-2 transport protein TqsA
VMVVLAQFDGTRWIAVLLSQDGDPHSLGAPVRAMPAARSQKSEAAAL